MTEITYKQLPQITIKDKKYIVLDIDNDDVIIETPTLQEPYKVTSKELIEDSFREDLELILDDLISDSTINTYTTKSKLQKIADATYQKYATRFVQDYYFDRSFYHNMPVAIKVGDNLLLNLKQQFKDFFINEAKNYLD